MDFKEIANRYQTAMNTVSRGINNILKERINSDVTTDQFATLQFIQKNEPCTSTDIANAFAVGKSAVTAQITRLHDKGLIERLRDQIDRRNIYLKLTSKGIDLVQYTEKELYKVLATQLAYFNDGEIRTFIHSLEKLAKIIEEN